MNKHILFYLFIVSLLITSLVITSGCGKTNFFANIGLASKSGEANLQIADQALGSGNYNEAIRLTENDTSEKGKEINARATIYNEGVSVTDIAAKILEVSTTDTDIESIQKSIPITADTNTLKEATKKIESVSGVSSADKGIFEMTTGFVGVRSVFDKNGDGIVNDLDMVDSLWGSTPEAANEARATAWNVKTEDITLITTGADNITSGSASADFQSQVAQMKQSITDISAATSGGLTSDEMKALWTQ